ncbi:MAG: hypothetical protein ACI4SH_08495 [Candidatus Scatosoma sp.]
MKKYTMPKVVIKTLSKTDIIATSGEFTPVENELPWQPVGGGAQNGLTSL